MDGSLNIPLPQGASYDSYNTYIYVNIVDNDNGVTTFRLPSPVQVNPNSQILNTIIQQFLNPSMGGSILNTLYTGNSAQTTQTLLLLSSALNGASQSDKLALMSLGKSLNNLNIDIKAPISIF